MPISMSSLLRERDGGTENEHCRMAGCHGCCFVFTGGASMNDTFPREFDFANFSPDKPQGFEGFLPLGTLMESGCSQIPRESGIYIVSRSRKSLPEFLPDSPVAAYKGKNPRVPVADLQKRWLQDVPVLYIGKAGGGRSRATLYSRLKPYMRFGCGEPAPHWGGRYIWQIADVRDCLLAWRPLPGQDSELYEKYLIACFIARYGRFPFANLRR